jgi:hypothetical protein
MIGLERRARRRKRGRKGVVYMPKAQSGPRLSVGKGWPRRPKITRWKNDQIRVGKPDKSTYGVIIVRQVCT